MPPSPARLTFRRCFALTFFLLTPLSCEQPRASEASGPQVVQFVPGIRIDYRIPQVEVEARVILRQGQLELFAYSSAPVPKEHESILRLEPRAESIYQALGLIGLTPGHPPRYDADTNRQHPATGDFVDVLVRYESEGGPVEVSACDWMLDLHERQPMKPTPWVFAGSRRTTDGVFAANLEGTTITVVDFNSAVLALPDLHSSSDSELWLAANAEAVPPEGTSVLLLLRPAAGPPP